jgi:hypothetical protein
VSDSAPAARRLQDELRDYARDVPWQPLQRLLEDETFFQEFESADRLAQWQRDHHRRMTLVTAVAGVGLLLAALVEEKVPEPSWIRLAELSLGLAVVFAIVAGKARRYHHRWLATRTRAERLRLLFFSTLADPEFWRTGKPRSGWPRLKEVELQQWAKGGSLPEIPRPDADYPPVPDGLVRFYEKARLATQIEYFESKEKREQARFWDDPSFVQSIFFASVVLIIVHTLIADRLELLDKILLFFAAALPTLFAGFRTWRSSNELARNRARAQAKRSQLIDLETALKDATAPWSVLVTMRLSEALLEEEQREWARLMTEAEWFG